MPKCFFFNRKIRVGILGGSFNPAHEGHIHISLIAKKRLNLDEVWWLVSPQNRLKIESIISTYKKRLYFARELTSHHRAIRVLDLEYINKIFTSNKTVNFLKNKTQNTRFVWLIGSDVLLNFHKWIKPKEISKNFPVAVIERPSYSYKVINILGASILGKRHKNIKFKLLNYSKPSWSFLRGKLNNTSSSKIKKFYPTHDR